MDYLIGFVISFITIVLLIIISYYNSVIRLHNQMLETNSGIDVALKKRFDLIPNLVETVKGYAKHEKETLENIAMIRFSGNPKAQANESQTALNKILMIAEGYPDLKASEHFLSLQRNLSDVEEHLQAARRLYNRKVSEYNTKIEQFPGSFIANQMKYKKADFFEANVGSEVPKVSINN